MGSEKDAHPARHRSLLFMPCARGFVLRLESDHTTLPNTWAFTTIEEVAAFLLAAYQPAPRE